jgi:hypothetical protein
MKYSEKRRLWYINPDIPRVANSPLTMEADMSRSKHINTALLVTMAMTGAGGFVMVLAMMFDFFDISLVPVLLAVCASASAFLGTAAFLSSAFQGPKGPINTTGPKSTDAMTREDGNRLRGRIFHAIFILSVVFIMAMSSNAAKDVSTATYELIIAMTLLACASGIIGVHAMSRGFDALVAGSVHKMINRLNCGSRKNDVINLAFIASTATTGIVSVLILSDVERVKPDSFWENMYMAISIGCFLAWAIIVVASHASGLEQYQQTGTNEESATSSSKATETIEEVTNRRSLGIMTLEVAVVALVGMFALQDLRSEDAIDYAHPPKKYSALVVFSVVLTLRIAEQKIAMLVKAAADKYMDVARASASGSSNPSIRALCAVCIGDAVATMAISVTSAWGWITLEQDTKTSAALLFGLFSLSTVLAVMMFASRRWANNDTKCGAIEVYIIELMLAQLFAIVAMFQGPSDTPTTPGLSRETWAVQGTILHVSLVVAATSILWDAMAVTAKSKSE